MSVNYSQQLSPYPNKGKCGARELFDKQNDLLTKSNLLSEMLKNSPYTVFLTGAGISTSCGIPDFRGPKGIWTLENKGESCKTDITFDQAEPSLTHKAITKLDKLGMIEYLISQNVDGLHVKSGFPSHKLAEIHGNMFARQCHICSRKYILPNPSPTLGLKFTGEKCDSMRPFRQNEQPKSQNENLIVSDDYRSCRGKLKDTILDWEDQLPFGDLKNSEKHSKKSKLFVCLGTSLQIFPCANFPRMAKKNGAKLVIINLQKTRLVNKFY
ncbi:unnamed protein product [Gordionus sp. m RMFG-2023]